MTTEPDFSQEPEGDQPVPYSKRDFDQGDLAASPVWRRILERPYEADLFSVLRWLDTRSRTRPLLGRAARPHFEIIRLGQEPSLAFAPSTVAQVIEEKQRPRLTIYGFGLFGPHGPLPLHLTEYARDRLRRFNDPTMVRFADIFHHRLTLLFYRAWADMQPAASLDRPGGDRFTNYVASLIGYGQPGMRGRDDVSDHAKFFHAPHFARQTRNPEGLAKILSDYLKVPVKVEEFVTHWIKLPKSEQSRLSQFHGNNRLEDEALLGETVLDGQHKIRIHIGPMPLTRYRSLLPGSAAARQLMTWIRNYVGLEFFIDVKMILLKEEVASASLGETTPLGWISWMGERNSELDADDLVLE